jgi:mgtE-like transporter
MPKLVRPLAAALRGLLGPDAAGARQSLVALLLNSSTSLVAGAFLGSITGTLDRYPGLLMLVPAAIGLRGNIFGAFGNRLSTAIHAGIFRLSLRRESVLGQNAIAAMILTAGLSMLLALIVKTAAVGLAVEGSIGLLDLATVSIAGGVLASVAVLVAVVGLTVGATRYGWDLDNVSAPIASVLGDVLTLPALFAATFLLGISVVTPLIGLVLVVAAATVLGLGWVSPRLELRRIVRESLPILLIAACISTGAGIALEKGFSAFEALPGLLVMVPAHLSSAGALGGILSGRLSTKILLGYVDPSPTPGREARRDIATTMLLGIPVYLFNALGALAVSRLLGLDTPSTLAMVAASLIAGAAAMAIVVVMAYYGAIASLRVGVDPDTYGIPIVSSTVDFAGAVALIITISTLGVVPAT